MRVIDSGDIHELPTLQVELTADELHRVVVALDTVGRFLERDNLYALQHKAEHYRHLAQKLDDGYAELVHTPRTYVYSGPGEPSPNMQVQSGGFPG